MVLKRRLEYGFSGYQIPVIPKAPRSVRRRGPRKKLVDDHQICAFELLAAVAGKLLQESESSASSNASEPKDLLGIHLDGIKQERVEENNKTVRSECLDQGSCVESAFIPELAVKEHNSNPSLGDLPNTENDSFSERTSTLLSSDFSKKVDCELKLGICNDKTEGNLNSKAEDDTYALGDLSNSKTGNESVRQSEDETKQGKDLTAANPCSVKNTVEKCTNRKPLINSDSSVQLSLYRDPLPSASFPKHRNDVNLGIRDDDDNSFRCSKFSTKFRAFRPQPRNGYRRIRKMLTSKYWKVAPKLRDYELSNNNEAMRPCFRNRKSIHVRDRCLREVPSKRRRLCDRSFVVAYDQETSSESISNAPEKGTKGDNCSSDAINKKGNAASQSVKVHQKSKDHKVKLSIKSFKIPELYIEIPETATVGSLKRTVMETVTAILGGGLRVGVVLQGKKVRDDNRTLQQAGILQSGNLDNLGFMLEPTLTQVPESPKDSPHKLHCETDQNLCRSPASPVLGSGLSNDAFDSPSKMEQLHESNHVAIHSPRTNTDTVTDGEVPDSRALVTLPAVSAEALAMVPVNQKPKRCESSQRRTRRPFSVAEVEALVEAVEILGTGRWRDVKMRAFDNADHRTYVDLKDKWKTLVHTASISPQQRRGEPVPQELLDRVLSAHAYWSQHQSKQTGKHHVEPLKIMDAQAD
uniref:MYB-like DNA-binding protein n=1 Tax=Catharanthus roseus TaxID=4058 RepID=Q9FNS1_CATRO|nr:MYB-like DNA-binding protein [Catharanthus roseus]